ncbi:MAG TPA: hypothetical protein VII76_10420 [Acidimicrobiales bacterium]
MSEVVYVLGAGFNCSLVDASFPGREAPLARNFFQVLIRSGRLLERLDGLQRHLHVDELLKRIEAYWHLSLEDLGTASLDIEECLTLLESLSVDGGTSVEGGGASLAAQALRGLLLDYLSEFSIPRGGTPTSRRFGEEIMASKSDVLTFNYDTLAEDAIASASGIGPNPSPPPHSVRIFGAPVPDEYLSASHLAWKKTLACGFEFDEVALPVAGVTQYVEGNRYYSHPENKLYESRRVLKLHGSVDWLRHTTRRAIPAEFTPEAAGTPPAGLLQESFAMWHMGEPPRRGPWYMDPLIIPPLLYKQYDDGPLPMVWAHALETLSSCRRLVVIGYSFPPTDFRTRRLFLEAFAGNHQLESLAVINPDPVVAGAVRELTRYSGPVVTCQDLTSYYGVSKSWFPDSPTPRQT